MERRSGWTLAALAAPCLPLAGLGLPLVVYLPEYYASDLGLSLGVVGSAFFAVRLLDMAFDPFMGGVMDRTRSRFGRFRLWFVLGTPLVMLASYMLFMAEPGVTGVYLWFWLLVIYGGFSITTLSQVAWASVLSANYDQRSRIYAWWQGGNIVGLILVLALPALLAKLQAADHGAGIRAMGWFIVVLLPLAVALAVLKVPEPRVISSPERAGLGEYFKLMSRPTVIRLLVVDLFVAIGPAITGALFFFYFEHVKGFDKGAASLLLLIYFVGGLLGAPIWTNLAFRIGKHRALAVSGLFYALVTAGVTFMPPGAFLPAAVMMVLIGLPYSAGAFLLRAMMADVGDEERLERGVDRTGLLYALLSGTSKVSSAASVGITFPVLDLLGFNPQNPNATTGLLGLQVMFLAAPIVLSLLASIIILRYPLTSERHGDIRARLAARDLAEAAPEMAAKPLFAEEIHIATPHG